jgi:hypothetical protein
VTNLTAIPWRTWGSGVICAATSPDETSDTIIGRSGEAIAARACADHNAMLDLAWLAGKGWLVRLGIMGSPFGRLEPWEAQLSLQGLPPRHRACGASPGEVLAKAREWAEGQVT